MRIREIVIRVQRAVVKKKFSLEELFKRCDLNSDGSISQTELASAFEHLGIVKSISSEDAKLIMRYADRNSDNSINLTEFLSQFSTANDEEEVVEDTPLLVKKKSNTALQKRLRLIEKRWKKNKEITDSSSNEARRYPLRASAQTSLEQLGDLFFVSGSGSVSNDLSVSTNQAGGRPTIAVRGISLDANTPGRWVFEVQILSSGRACLGYASSNFSPNSRQAVGVGDDEYSWGFSVGGDKTAKRWGNQSAPYGFTVSSGDVIGCLVEIRDGTFEISYSMNGEFGDGFGVAFKLSNRSSSFSLTPVMSFERGFQGRFNLGRTSFRYPPRQATSIQYYAQRSLIDRVVSSAGTSYGTLRTTTGDAGMKIDENVVEVTGGFPSCVLAGCVLTRGKYYFEATIHAPGHAVQIGFGDVSFIGTSRGGQGIGDDKSSWAFDGMFER